MFDLVEVLLGCSVFDENLKALYLGKGQDGRESSAHQWLSSRINVSQKQQSLELCKRFGHQQWHLAS